MPSRRIAALLLLLAAGCGQTLPRGGDPADLEFPEEVPLADPTLPAALDLLASHLEATGMRAVIESSSSVVIRGRVQHREWNSEGTFEACRARPARSSMTMWLPGVGEASYVFDGTIGWMLHPIVGPELFEGATLAKARINAVYDQLLRRPEGLETYVTVAKKRFAGHDCYEVFGLYAFSEDVRATIADRSFREYYDVDTGLLVGLVERSKTTASSSRVESVFSDYERFGAGLVATRTRQRSNGIELVLLVDEVEYDAVTDETFAIPDEIRALTGG